MSKRDNDHLNRYKKDSSELFEQHFVTGCVTLLFFSIGFLIFSEVVEPLGFDRPVLDMVYAGGLVLLTCYILASGLMAVFMRRAEKLEESEHKEE